MFVNIIMSFWIENKKDSPSRELSFIYTQYFFQANAKIVSYNTRTMSPAAGTRILISGNEMSILVNAAGRSRSGLISSIKVLCIVPASVIAASQE